jgi:DsbC/DsbD-like thiol-disulfide interchange protein
LNIRPLWVIALVAIAVTIASAQSGPPAPVITPIVESPAVHAGTTARLALRVHFPPGYHIQSNKPRDPSLIAAALALSPPDGVTVNEIVFPPASDLKVAGLPELLAVFEEEFIVGIQVDVAAGKSPGDVAIPAQLRYQACNETMCFGPKTVPVEWTFRVVAAGTKVTATNAEVFGGIKFGQGERP